MSFFIRTLKDFKFELILLMFLQLYFSICFAYINIFISKVIEDINYHNRANIPYLSFLIVVTEPLIMGLFIYKVCLKSHHLFSKLPISASNSPSFISKAISTCADTSMVAMTLISNPISSSVLVIIMLREVDKFYVVFLVALIPFLISYQLGKKKRVNANDIVNALHERSRNFAAWAMNTNSSNKFPVKIFEKEISERDKETYYEESSNIIPRITMIMTVIILWAYNFISKEEVILVYASAYVMINAFVEFNLNTAQITRANSFSKALQGSYNVSP